MEETPHQQRVNRKIKAIFDLTGENEKPYTYLPPKAIEDYNRTYVEPLVTNYKRVNYSSNTMARCRTELRHEARVNEAITGSHVVRSRIVRQVKVRSEYRTLASAITDLTKLEYIHTNMSAFSILITSPQVKRIKELRANEASYETYIDTKGNNAVKSLSKERANVGKALASYYSDESITILNHHLKPYSLELDIETKYSTYATPQNRRKLMIKPHLHGLLILPTKDVNSVTKLINSTLEKGYNAELVTVNNDYENYRMQGNQPINLNSMDNNDYKALEATAVYANKQVGFTDVNDEAKDNNGKGLRFTQKDILYSFDEKTRVQAIIALANTNKGVAKRAKYGLIKQLSKLIEIHMLVVAMESRKFKQLLIELKDFGEKQKQLNTEYPFNLIKTKPPPLKNVPYCLLI